MRRTPTRVETRSIRTCSRPAVICRRGPTWMRAASGSGACRMAVCSRRRRWRATRTCSSRARTSPVFIVHGDDDRNVDFAQTVGLVQLLRARNVYYELTVIPDDLHESQIHENWVNTFNRMGDFFKRFVWNKETPGTVQAGKAPPK